jgi:DNA repair photolyase
MPLIETRAKSLLRKQKKIESWFVSRYGMNLYRGCTHNCAYCDGRAEKYRVQGEYGRDVEVKVNAAQLLKKELDPSRRRIPLKKGFVFVGGGVCDTYQPAEQTCGLTRGALEILADSNFPVHILTKSTLVLRDAELIRKINTNTRAMVSFSFSSVDPEISRIFEPGVPDPVERLEAIAYLKSLGISCGMYLLPVIPHVTDSVEKIERSVAMARDSGVDFIVFGGMTLKQGRQEDHFMDVLRRYDPALPEAYRAIYHGCSWGSASSDYFNSIQQIFNRAARRYHMPRRIPLRLFKDWVDENDRVVILLEHMDFLLKADGKKSPYGFAAYSLSGIKEPLCDLRDDLRRIKGVNASVEKTVLEILDTGTCAEYERLMGE